MISGDFRPPPPRGLAPLAALGLAAALAGCVDTEWFQGSESTISFAWTITGGAPLAVCDTVRATHVHLWIAQDLPTCTLEAESCGVREPDWEWDCIDGTATTATVFAAVTIYVGWTLVDSAGTVLAWTPWQPATLAPGDNFLGTQDFAP